MKILVTSPRSRPGCVVAVLALIAGCGSSGGQPAAGDSSPAVRSNDRGADPSDAGSGDLDRDPAPSAPDEVRDPNQGGARMAAALVGPPDASGTAARPVDLL